MTFDYSHEEERESLRLRAYFWSGFAWGTVNAMGLLALALLALWLFA